MNDRDSKKRTIQVNYLARVEGEGALYLSMKDDTIEDVKLKIFEPPRFFEALLRGRHCFEAPDITARICGICPVAYQMSAVHAVEKALAAASLPEHIRLLRRLLYCGEWIESHCLHMFMLHAPDFLRFPNVVELAKHHPQVVQTGLALKKAGNAIVQLLGGREIHPINVRVGGFYALPRRSAFAALRTQLETAAAQMDDVLGFVKSLQYPELERDYEFVSLQHPSEYPLCEGDIVSSKGLRIGANDCEDYESFFEEKHVEHSHALHSTIRGRGSYLCGPMARMRLNYEVLPDACKAAAKKLGIEGGTLNPFKSMLVRAVEVTFAFEEAIRILNRVLLSAEIGEQAFVHITLCKGVGAAATEAPRGLLYHRYSIAGDGLIEKAVIVPPTSQNQLSIEEDVAQVATKNHQLDDASLQHLCEQTIRNYDPCISCATHFLKIVRSPAACSEGLPGSVPAPGHKSLR